MRDDSRVYLELRLSKAIETDENGNWIIEAEASNENLDFDGQIVLQRALLDSKDYFLKNGVISYDHRHLHADPDDPNWSPEKYIIGEPIDVYKQGNKTFVKAKLYKSSQLAKEVVSKLKDGSTRIKTSVGGRQPEVVTEWDHKFSRPVEKVAKVLWDELAITFKPVNQTLSPVALSSAAFVKSLQAGFETDASSKTGGGALVTEDLEGTKEKKTKSKRWAVVTGLINGDMSNPDEVRQFLTNRGSNADEADQILRSIIADRDRIRMEVQNMADTELLKAFDESMDTLEKACKKAGKSKAEDTDADVVAEEGYAKEPPEEAIKGGLQEDEEEEGEMGPDNEEEEEDEGDEEEFDEPPASSKKKLKKSFYDDVRDSSEEFLDISSFLDNMTKSLSRRFDAIEQELHAVTKMQKALGGGVVSTGKLVKSIADIPAPRQAVLNKQQRTFMGNDGKAETMSRAEILEKAQKAVSEGKLSITDASVLEERLNKGLPINDASLRLLKSI